MNRDVLHGIAVWVLDQNNDRIRQLVPYPARLAATRDDHERLRITVDGKAKTRERGRNQRIDEPGTIALSRAQLHLNRD